MIAGLIRDERELRNLTQEQLADQSGVSLRSISNLENAKHVSDFIAKKVMDYLDYELVIRYEVKKKQ